MAKNTETPKSITYNGFTLTEGKKYRWSGTYEGLYHINSWTKTSCKVIKIVGKKVHLHQKEFSDNPYSNRKNPKETTVLSIKTFDECGVIFFKRRKLF